MHPLCISQRILSLGQLVRRYVISVGNPGFLHSLTLDRRSACKTTLGLYILYNKSKKKHIFTILGSKGKPLKNFTFDLDVLKSTLLEKNEEQ